MVVAATTATTFGRHHARFGLDLNFGIDLEIALRHDQLALIQPVADEVIVTGPRPQHDLAALEGRLSLWRELLAGLVHRHFDARQGSAQPLSRFAAR